MWSCLPFSKHFLTEKDHIKWWFWWPSFATYGRPTLVLVLVGTARALWVCKLHPNAGNSPCIHGSRSFIQDWGRGLEGTKYLFRTVPRKSRGSNHKAKALRNKGVKAEKSKCRKEKIQHLMPDKHILLNEERKLCEAYSLGSCGSHRILVPTVELRQARYFHEELQKLSCTRVRGTPVPLHSVVLHVSQQISRS